MAAVRVSQKGMVLHPHLRKNNCCALGNDSNYGTLQLNLISFLLFVGFVCVFVCSIDCYQEENRPVGGFSLRGCLVSALEDNGVPAGKE